VNRFDLVVFDLDGTLVDSLQDLAASVNFTLMHYGACALSASSIQNFVGDGTQALVQRSFQAAGIESRWQEALPEFLKHYQPHCLSTTRPYPGIPETLQRLHKQVKLAVLTNKPSASTNHILEGLQLRQFFDAIAGGDTFQHRKPDPRGLRSLMKQFDATPKRTLMVGDSQIDMETGRRAGAWTCGVAYGMKSKEICGADAIIDKPRELENMITIT
jgi:phosphoglycolate phosphatase